MCHPPHLPVLTIRNCRRCPPGSLCRCWLGGCFGTFSRLYGSAASNLLQARVILANGTIVTTNSYQNPDLFWSLRGGAAGLGGVVTEFTARTHAPPRWFISAGASFETDDLPTFQQLVEQVLLQTRTLVLNASWSGYVGFQRNKPSGGGYSVSFTDKAFEGDIAFGQAIMQPLVDWVAAQPAGTITGPTNASQITWSVWNASSWQPGQPFPWMEVHPDREISTALVGSFSKYPTLSSLFDPDQLSQVAWAFANLTDQQPFIPSFPFGIDIEKGQARASPFAQALFDETAQNPILLDSIGLFLVMVNVPSLPQLPPSAPLLASLWPRLKEYLFTSQSSDPIYPTCVDGATGNNTAAVECFDAINNRIIPTIRAAVNGMNETMWRTWPNFANTSTTTNGNDGQEQQQQLRHVSGSYWNEADYFDPEWQASLWGPPSNYAALRAVKDAYDPQGLFVCHHCVGSEDWSADGNCRLQRQITSA